MATRSGNRSKNKRSVPTTLGKAPPNSNYEFIDLSHLRKPIDTSIFGLSQILSLFETATDEVRRYIAHECELMFECRVCRTVFRSLANFILHKRNYCPEFFNPISDSNKSDFEDSELTFIDKDNILSSPNEKIKDLETTPRRYPKRNLSLVLQKLSDKQECEKMVEDIVNEELTNEKEISEGSPLKTFCLEAIDTNNEGVFQTTNCKQIGNDLMKSEVMEIHSILNTSEAILGPDGKVFSFRTEVNDTPAQKLTCTICNLKFATKKTLTHHIKYKHNETRVVYICPECKDSFANAWCVFRHLYKIHRKTTAQIRRMRDQIHSSTIIKKHEVANRKTSSTIDGKNCANNQSNNPYYDVEFQFCEGCGKRFDRRAALNSHVQGCLKRIAAHNVTKEKESQEHVNKQSMITVKGSKRRKPKISQRIMQNNNLEVIIENKEVMCRSEETLANATSNLGQTIECIKTHNDSSSNANDMINTDKQIIPSHSITNAKDVADQKRIIQEIIFGSSETTTDDGLSEAPAAGNYIGLVSDEEEVLGFVKQSDVLSKDNACDEYIGETDEPKFLNKEENTENMKKVIPAIEETVITEGDLIQDIAVETSIEIESTATYIPTASDMIIHNIINPEISETIKLNENYILPQDAVVKNVCNRQANVEDLIEREPSKLITIDLIDNEEQNVAKQNIMDKEVDNFPKISMLRQYSSKKAKARKLDKLTGKNNVLHNTSAEELNTSQIAEGNINSSNNNADATVVDLASEIETAEIAIAAEYDVSEVINISESEESETCSCFDGKSNDSCSSYDSRNRHDANVNTSDNYSDKALAALTKNSEIIEEQHENKRLSRKRKNSIAIQDDLNDVLVNKCNDYVDWNRVMCQPCSKIFSTESDLLTHMALHFNWLQYQCNICNFCSYDKRTCTQHVATHDINKDSINNLIIPLPYWKTVYMATPFSSNIKEQDVHVEEPTSSNKDATSDNKSENTANSDNMSEHINKDECRLTCNASKIKTQDPMLRKMIMEVIFGSEQNAVKRPLGANLSTRPVRNRVSVKSLQKDFEYDMKQIDSKVKKPTVDNKVKPIKIVKNNDENFCIVSSNVSQNIHKKKRT